MHNTGAGLEHEEKVFGLAGYRSTSIHDRAAAVEAGPNMAGDESWR